MLCVIGPDGALITKDGRSRVTEDANGAKFPWKPKSVFEVLADAVVDKSGKKLSTDVLKTKTSFAIYFSAHWCPPCRAFTPKLVSLYTQIKATHGDSVEFIFASRDKDQAAFDEYYHEMPWATIVFGHQAVSELASLYNVSGIPTLVTVNAADGKTINDDARGQASEEDACSKYPWPPEALEPVTDLVASDAVIEALNGKICVCLALNGSGNKETPIAEFTRAGQAVVQGLGPDKAAGLQFLVVKADDLFERVLQVLQVQAPPTGKAFVLAMNLPNNKAKEMLTSDISELAVVAFASRFFAAQADEE
jgi:thiol-disulfide isomerase/thioredoxin